MRRLGTFTNVEAAKRCTETLSRRGFAVTLRPEPDGSAGIWIADEEHVSAARRALAACEAGQEAAEPFPSAPPVATEGEPDEVPATVVRPRRHVLERAPLTLGLILLCLAVGIGTDFGDIETKLWNALSIASWRIVNGDAGSSVVWGGLDDVLAGQVWRLVTPMLLHSWPWHFAFNMLWLWSLGSAIEGQRGSMRLLWLVLGIAAASNLAEYYAVLDFDLGANRGLNAGWGIDPNPLFGGMSGVTFGLFGFIWMRARLLPESGFTMPRDLVVWMMIYLLACTAGLLGPIANTAHLSGLLVGGAVGAAPRLWRP